MQMVDLLQGLWHLQCQPPPLLSHAPFPRPPRTYFLSLKYVTFTLPLAYVEKPPSALAGVLSGYSMGPH